MDNQFNLQLPPKFCSCSFEIYNLQDSKFQIQLSQLYKKSLYLSINIGLYAFNLSTIKIQDKLNDYTKSITQSNTHYDLYSALQTEPINKT